MQQVFPWAHQYRRRKRQTVLCPNWRILIEESVVICQPPLQMGEEIAFKYGRISDFQELVT